MRKIYVNFAVGLNRPVSIELTVVLENPTDFANAVWERFSSRRVSIKRFLRIFFLTWAHPTMSLGQLAMIKMQSDQKQSIE